MTSTAENQQVVWKLGELLQERGQTAYKLAAVLHGTMNRNSVYTIARGDTERVDLKTLRALLLGLEKLTGERFGVGDLLEYTPGEPGQQPLTAAGVPYTGDAETDAVLNDHPDILDRIAELERGEVKLIPLHEVIGKYGADS